MGWQDAPVVKVGGDGVQPAWMSAPPVVAAAAPKTDASPGPLDVLKGVGDATLSGASKLSTGVVGSAAGLVNRLLSAATGGDGQAASDATKADINRRFGYDTQTPVGQSIGRAVSSALAPIGGVLNSAGQTIESGGEHLGIPKSFTHAQLSEAGELANAIPMLSGVARGAGAASDAATLAAANAAKPLTAASSMDDILAAVGYPRLPSKNPNASTGAKIGSSIVGENSLTGPQTMTSQAISNRLAQHEAGVPPEQELSAENLAAVRAAGPAKVYDAAHDALPTTLKQDPNLKSAIANVGDTTSLLPKSPDVDAFKAYMIQQPEFSTDQVFSTISQAREKAASLYKSDLPDSHALADAYQKVANAYEDFVGRRLNENPLSPVSLGDWQKARTQFAKNYAVQGALDGPNINAAKLSTLAQKDPGAMTGGLRLIAEQEARYPLSTGFGPKTLPDTGAGASGSIPGQVTRHVTGPLLGGGLGALIGGTPGALIGGGLGELAGTTLQNVIRKALSGTPESGRAAASAALEDPRLEDFFNPPKPPEKPPGPLELKPPPGRAFEPHQPDLATGATPQRDFFGYGIGGMKADSPMTGPVAQPPGHPGEIDLHDVLAHGVEQPPPAGLSLAPMGAPAQSGIPFQVNAEHAAGDLDTAEDAKTGPHKEPTMQDLLEQLQDLPSVMHQNRSTGLTGDLMNQLSTSPGVPEGITTRVNNASGESPASVEAINRGKREQAEGQDRFLVDPDGKMWPIRGVEAADARAPQGSIIIQKGIGGTPYSILDRGGLPQSHANGLMNRALAGGNGLSLMDLLNGQ